ncbi:MAG TPA: hypothetical protein VKU02_07690 [Gemmataceae bacterium]|nr:hypothetical protein [Gemmataceae bacterium]
MAKPDLLGDGMPTMTLEQNCVLVLLGLLDLQQVEPEEPAALAQLRRWGEEGIVSLWASRSADEAVFNKSDLPVSEVPPPVLPEWLSHLPRLGASLPEEEVTASWARGGGYPRVRVNAALSERVQRLKRMLGTAADWPAAVELLEHQEHGNEWFVTLDRRMLLTKHGRDNLRRHWHIRVCSPVEAVGIVCLQNPPTMTGLGH